MEALREIVGEMPFARRFYVVVAGAVINVGLMGPLSAQTVPAIADVPKPNSLRLDELVMTHRAPAYFEAFFRSMLKAPQPKAVYPQTVPAVINQAQIDPDPDGRIMSYLPGGTVVTANNAFFQSLGTNGRSCFSCHQPAFGMSVSAAGVRQTFLRTGGRDPIFAPSDGATCPKNVPPAFTAGAQVGGKLGAGIGKLIDAYKTLLGRGLIRVALPVPVAADYKIEVVSDPYGCNTDTETNTQTDSTGKRQLISVYRRPRISAETQFATATNRPGVTANIMWDGREPDLATQAVDATEIHAVTTKIPTPEQVKQIVDFENGIFTAQGWSTAAHGLSDFALGGPVYLSTLQPGLSSPPPLPLYQAWANLPKTADSAAQRAAIARGQVVFNTKTFVINNDAGINQLPGTTAGAPNPLPGAHCSSCHSQVGSGGDVFPGAQQDQGIGGDSPNVGGPAPSSFLPVFRITCNPGASSGFHGNVVTTNDPGAALITGKCADVGRFTVTQLRGLDSRAPYFSDGSASTLQDVVDFYDKRFAIHFTSQEKSDLVAFMKAL